MWRGAPSTLGLVRWRRGAGEWGGRRVGAAAAATATALGDYRPRPMAAASPSLWTCKRLIHRTTRLWLEPSKGVGAAAAGCARAPKGEGQPEKAAEAAQPPQKPQRPKAHKTAVKARTAAAGGSIVTEEALQKIPVYRVVTHVMRHLWPPGQPKYRALVVASVMCVITAKMLKVAVPFWFKMVVDALAPGHNVAEAVAVLGPWQLGVFGMVAAYGVTRLTSSLTEELKTALFAPVGSHASTTIAMEMFRKLHSLDLHFHLSRETGVLSKDLDRGSRAFWALAYALLFLIVPTAFEVVLVCTALQTSAGLSFILTALSAVFAYIGWTYAVSNWRAVYRERYNKGDSRVGGLTVDSLLNYETVKYFGREDYEEERLRRETMKTNRDLARLDQSMAVLNFGQQAIFVLAALTCLYLSTCGVVAGAMTVGDMVLVDALLMQLYTPLSFLGMIYREVQSSTQNMQAMIALLDIESAVKEKPDARPLKLTAGTIELRDVCFRFDEHGAGRGILHNLSLTIPGGSTVAFVGPSGSGKSTIFRLLYRFYDPTAGAILIDGQPMTELQVSSLRRAIGVIPQDTVLFNETVRYNIRYGRLNATDTEVEEAARVASIHDSIMSMSQQYETCVGERGLKLSGGEKQRVAIARVVLDDPPILLADEATSALDTATEMRVMQRLRERGGKGRTIILVAHRLTTVKDADRIFRPGRQGRSGGEWQAR
ncbi:putative ATP-binding cassette protein subfamily B, member 3 [Trypanosoma conorhini]|uniref:Putative ATP-binding cassette protein subfamily B, member 3 n=1 Tax=Trypanosoma conorhini TaxID=83891 RepID=A0A3S5IUP5_9TRYP|nr:putative ATP-binding cassette protein subfamily B, member 3 [Trypanosoma conorhini]RNF27141.1 putative ATP-binding cassette protein subfamily B, member 3 [Trypanosoma conorhini]